MGEENDEDLRRKFQAKRWNEHTKLIATTLNTVALIILAAAALQPLLSASIAAPVNWLAVGISIILHLLAHGIIRLMRPE